MSRLPGSPGICSSCGAADHNGSGAPDGCSKTYRAALAVVAGKVTLMQAAERFGVSRQAIHKRIRRDGLRVPRGRVYR